jgi:hypothetical protein
MLKVVKYRAGEYGRASTLADYIKEETAVFEITHTNFFENVENFWLKSYGLTKWCIESDLAIQEIERKFNKAVMLLTEA